MFVAKSLPSRSRPADLGNHLVVLMTRESGADMLHKECTSLPPAHAPEADLII